jgi:acetyl-CoA C-acetyltransferase
MHSIATMAGELAKRPGARGLITANGGFLTSHSMGVYSATPPDQEFRWENVQSAVDREPTRTASADWSGTGTVEAWTAPFSRDGAPETAFVAVRTPDDRRTMAVLSDVKEAADAVTGDIAGAKIDVRPDGTATLR